MKYFLFILLTLTTFANSQSILVNQIFMTHDIYNDGVTYNIATFVMIKHNKRLQYLMLSHPMNSQLNWGSFHHPIHWLTYCGSIKAYILLPT